MKIWILGAGKFGLKACKALGSSASANEITVVESRRYLCMSLKLQNFNSVCADGIDFLVESLIHPDDSDWIVPALPLHVAYEWVKRKITPAQTVETLKVPEKICQRLPNVVYGDDGQIYTSNADFLCPPDCPEPDQVCSFTGKPRPRILFRELASLRYKGFRSIVVQSEQLAPGVGGYSAQSLFRALRLVRESRTPVLLSTACKCHGVMHAFALTPRRKKT